MTMNAIDVAELRARRPLFVQDESDRSAVRPEGYQDDDDSVQMTPEELAKLKEYSGGASVIEMKEKNAKVKKRSVVESVFWIAACCFILFYGNGKKHFLQAVIYDPRILKRQFYFGCLCALINTGIFIYLGVVVRLILRDPRHFDHAAPGALSAASLLGIMSFVLFGVALWPIFGAVIIPILWCFFMGLVVLSSFMPTIKEPNPKYLGGKDQ